MISSLIAKVLIVLGIILGLFLGLKCFLIIYKRLSKKTKASKQILQDKKLRATAIESSRNQFKDQEAPIEFDTINSKKPLQNNVILNEYIKGKPEIYLSQNESHSNQEIFISINSERRNLRPNFDIMGRKIEEEQAQREGKESMCFLRGEMPIVSLEVGESSDSTASINIQNKKIGEFNEKSGSKERIWSYEIRGASLETLKTNEEELLLYKQLKIIRNQSKERKKVLQEKVKC